jgi:hypothetical protein
MGIVMKTHYAEEFDDAVKPNETAEEHVWHEHRLAPASPLANTVAVVLLVAAFIALVKLSGPTASTPAVPVPSSLASRTADLSAPQFGDERER